MLFVLRTRRVRVEASAQGPHNLGRNPHLRHDRRTDRLLNWKRSAEGLIERYKARLDAKSLTPFTVVYVAAVPLAFGGSEELAVYRVVVFC